MSIMLPLQIESSRGLPSFTASIRNYSGLSVRTVRQKENWCACGVASLIAAESTVIQVV